MTPPLNKFKRLDVRAMILKGIEPCPKILDHLNKLEPDEGLVIVAPFLPSPLIEKLHGDGFFSKVERGKGTDWVVYFWRDAV